MGALVLFFVSVPFVTDRPWVKWLLFPFVILARAYGGEAAYDPENRGWINQLVKDNPWLKWWASFCGIAVVAIAVYVIRTNYQVSDDRLLVVVFASFAIVLGPFLVAHEYGRFRAYGE